MRILYLLYRYPQLSQTFVRNEIVGLRRSGIEVDVLSVDAGDTADVAAGWAGPVAAFPRTGYGAARGARELLHWSTRHPRRVARLLAHRSRDPEYRALGLRRVPALAAELVDRHYDRVHTHFAWPSADLARQLADLLGIPASVTVHAKDIFGRPWADLAPLEAMDDVVTVCRFNVDHLRAAGLRNPRLTVVPCGVEIPAAVEPVDAVIPIDVTDVTDVTDVVGVGRLIPKKGFDTLVDAVATVAADLPGLSVRIIGDGPERLRLQALIDAHRLQEVVRLTGPADHASTLAAIAGAKLFCLPARRAADGDMDALPVVLREAQARGVPLVTTTVAGIPEMVDDRSGWLVPPDDVPALAGALRAALTDPADRRARGAAGRARVRRTGSLDEQVRALTAVFTGAPRPTVRADISAAGPVAVSVIIPVHGDRGGLAGTLTCLSAQDFPDPFEILVVDNGDNPGLAAAVAAIAGTRVLTEDRPGSYAARNAGVRAARGPVLAFTDADCLPRPGWLAAGLRDLDAAGPKSFVGGRIVVDPGPRPGAAALWDAVSGLRQDDYVRDGWAATANLFVRRETLDLVGLFDATMTSTGDREWGTRAGAAGVQPVFSADAALDHPARPDFREARRKVARTAAGTQDFRARRGLPAFDDGEIRRTLRPWLRWYLQRSRSLGSSWDRTRYIAMAQLMQYQQLRARIAAERVRRDPEPGSR